MNPTTCLGDTCCWIQQVTPPTLVVTCWIQQPKCILPSTFTGGRSPPVRLECKMHVGRWIQQVTTRVGAVTCWIQQPVSPKQDVGFTCVINSEGDQLIRKLSVTGLQKHTFSDVVMGNIPVSTLHIFVFFMQPFQKVLTNKIQIHGYPGSVRVGRSTGGVGRWGIWAGAMGSKLSKTQKKKYKGD